MQQESGHIELYEGNAPARAAASAVSLLPVQEIEAQIARAEKMGEALDKLRSLAIQRTVPGDWVFHGENGYLEGDGGIRIAPMIGLRLDNVTKQIEMDESGVVRVTYTADASSALFGTSFGQVARTRTSADPFLAKGKGKADVENVASAAYKGLIARSVQLIAGLSGLTREDLKNRYGLDLSSGAGSVAFRGGQTAAKREDTAGAAGPIAEIHKLLLQVFGGNEKAAADWLEATTANKEKGWPGKRDANRLTEAGAKFVLARLQKMAQESREPGEEG